MGFVNFFVDSAIGEIVENSVLDQVGGFFQDKVEEGILGRRRSFPGAEKKNNAGPGGDRQITK